MDEPDYSFNTEQCPWYFLLDISGKLPVDVPRLKAYIRDNHHVLTTKTENWRQSSLPSETIILQTESFVRASDDKTVNFIGLTFHDDNPLVIKGEPPPHIAKNILDNILGKFPFPSQAYLMVLCAYEVHITFPYSPEMSLAEFDSLVTKSQYLDGTKPAEVDFNSSAQTPPLPQLYKNGAPQFYPPWWPFETMALYHQSAAPEKIPPAPDRNAPQPARHLLEGAAKALMASYGDIANIPVKSNPEFVTKTPEPAKVQPVLSPHQGRVIKSQGRYVYHGPADAVIKPEDEEFKVAFSHNQPLEQLESGTAAALRQLLPNETADMTDAQLEDLLNTSKLNAAAHGLPEQPDTLNWAVLSLLCGPDFDQEPHVNALLQLEYIPQTYRLSYLVAGLNFVLRDGNLIALQHESISTIVWIDKSKTPKDENTAQFKPGFYYISRMENGELLSRTPLFPDQLELRFEKWLWKNFDVTYFDRYRVEDSTTNIEQFDLRDESLEKYGIFNMEGQFNFNRAGLRLENVPPVFAARFIESFAKEFSSLEGIFVGGDIAGNPGAKPLALKQRDNWLELLTSKW